MKEAEEICSEILSLKNENIMLKKTLEGALHILKFYKNSDHYIPLNRDFNLINRREIGIQKNADATWRKTAIMQDWGVKATKFLEKNRKWFVLLNVKH